MKFARMMSSGMMSSRMQFLRVRFSRRRCHNKSQQWRDDSGQVGGIEVLPFGFLFFLSMTLLIANAWGVVDAKLAVMTAAREAVRAYVESDNATAAEAVAQTRAEEALKSYGRDVSRATIGDPVVAGGFGRCKRVTITVSYDLPVLTVPYLGGFGDLSAVTSKYSELIDPFRSGLAGGAQC